MTSAPADERLAARVAARIAGAREPRRWTWVLVPIAAAAVVVIAVFVARENRSAEASRSKHTQAPRSGDTQASRSGETRADITIATSGGPERPAPQPVESPALTRTRARVVPIVPIAQAPAPALDPIEIDSIAVEPIVVTNVIQITPIAIDRIDIAAMP